MGILEWISHSLFILDKRGGVIMKYFSKFEHPDGLLVRCHRSSMDVYRGRSKPMENKQTV